jgi:arsenite methyltransferase
MVDKTKSKKKPSYGIDAPGVIRNLFIAGAFLFILPFILPSVTIGKSTIDISWFIWPGINFIIGGILMMVYGFIGKYIHRDRMLNLIIWRGDEQVLDIGTGKGLMMIGAAKRLTTGFSTGIDIWNAEDLSGNKLENTRNNAKLEGVEDKIEIKNENAMNMSFTNESFDIILTNLCLHNIYDKEGRHTACLEIARVLKNGGTAVISDFRHVKEYKENFDILGFDTKLFMPNFFTTFPPLKILIVIKSVNHN